MNILYAVTDALGRVVELRRNSWAHMQKGHSEEFPSVEEFRTGAKESLGSPVRAWVAPENKRSGSTESEAFAGCSRDERISARYLLVLVEESATPRIKSARHVNRLPWHAYESRQLLEPQVPDPCVSANARVKRSVNEAYRQRRDRYG